MKRLRLSSRFEATGRELVHYAQLLAILFFVQRHIPKGFSLPAAVLLTLVYWMRVKSAHWPAVLILLFCCTVSIPAPIPKDIISGRVIRVQETYVTVQTAFSRIMIYTDQQLRYDSFVTVTGTPEKPQDSPGFYRFSFSDWCRRQGIIAVMHADSVTVHYQLPTMRSLLQKYLQTHYNEETGAILQRILLGVRNKDYSFAGLLEDSGFSWTAALALLDRLLKSKLSGSRREKLMRRLNLFLCIFYHFPLMLTQRLVYGLLNDRDLTRHERAGLTAALMLLVYPEAAASTGFQLIMAYRMFLSGEMSGRLQRFLFLSILASLSDSVVNPVRILLFPALRMLSGLLIWLSCLTVFIPLFPIVPIADAVDSLGRLLQPFAIPGNLLGFGLPFFLLLAATFRRHKKRLPIITALLYLFLLGGLFHPLGEITFLNVGQGDCFLLRAPLNRGNILIDTGKLSQHDNIVNLLNAKGIRHLDAIFVSHDDNDHSGNAERLSAEYRCPVITGSFGQWQKGPFLLLELNPARSDNDNDNSQVIYTEVNHLKFLFTGDISQDVERRLIRQYGNLRADVLKLSHHGSQTGTAAELLNAIQPRLAVISCGAYSIYHHPDPQVLERLNNAHVPYLTTRKEGDVSIFFLPRMNLLVTAQRKIDIINT
ncbi:MAG: MBL fold metallo-hydrolase [Solobacterium sp.]|nr:MBL fold metallo-hydrolase [Solobacterium sp.]